MRRDTVLTTMEAVNILFPEGVDPADPWAQFRSGSDVCELLAEHFDFSGEAYAAMLALEPEVPVGDVEVLLCGLNVGSLEELRDLVEAGRRVRDRVPLVVV